MKPKIVVNLTDVRLNWFKTLLLKGLFCLVIYFLLASSLIIALFLLMVRRFFFVDILKVFRQQKSKTIHEVFTREVKDLIFTFSVNQLIGSVMAMFSTQCFIF